MTGNKESSYSDLKPLLVSCQCSDSSLVPRPPLDLPAFNVARKKREVERGPGDEATVTVLIGSGSPKCIIKFVEVCHRGFQFTFSLYSDIARCPPPSLN